MIYITGATGFSGERLARRLIARGEQVRCLVRSPQRGQKLQQLGAEFIVGDVTDVGVHQAGLRDARLAFHLAALYDIGVVDAAALRKTNIEGTRSLVKPLIWSCRGVPAGAKVPTQFLQYRWPQG